MNWGYKEGCSNCKDGCVVCGSDFKERLEEAEKIIEDLQRNHYSDMQDLANINIQSHRTNEKLREEIALLRQIAYVYKNLDCHSSEEGIEAITIKGWKAQLKYEKWYLENRGDLVFYDWEKIESDLRDEQ